MAFDISTIMAGVNEFFFRIVDDDLEDSTVDFCADPPGWDLLIAHLCPPEAVDIDLVAKAFVLLTS